VDQHRGDAPEYKVGEKVWLSTENLDLGRESKKLTSKWVGLYIITKIVSANVVRLKLPASMWIHLVVNMTWINPYRASTIPGQMAEEQLAITVGTEEEYEVEEVLDSRTQG
jgi:hypothetical protein